MSDLPVVCIVGPTATGKSEVADEVAAELGSGVISADAMQVYRGMDIGTAKVAPERRRTPLSMVDVADVSTPYSVALYQRGARAAVDGWLARGRIPVVCGGTGLYVRAIVDEMAYARGEAGSASRERWESYLADHGPDGLWAELDRRDPASAALIHPHNARRVVRALEMLDEGHSYAEQTSGLHEVGEHYPVRMWGLTRDRARLYEAIERRVDAMVEEGLVDEVRKLMEAGLLDSPTASAAIGYKELAAHLRGEESLEEAVDAIKRRTRRYAKRQFTWFRRDRRVRWLDVDELGYGAIVGMVVDDAREGAAQ